MLRQVGARYELMETIRWELFFLIFSTKLFALRVALMPKREIQYKKEYKKQKNCFNIHVQIVCFVQFTRNKYHKKRTVKILNCWEYNF